MLMSLAEEIEAQNAWFNSKQDAFYLWFKDGGKETFQKFLAEHSEKHRDGNAKFDGFDKYIIDAGDYSFLLVGSDGSVDKLSQTFNLSEEINRDEIKAEYLNGILSITLPKKEEVKISKEIQIA